MVGTRRASSRGPEGEDDDDGEAAARKELQKKAVARTLNKLRIDGNPALRGQSVEKTVPDQTNHTAETYRYRGAVYAKDASTKPEWIQESAQRGRKRARSTTAPAAAESPLTRTRNSNARRASQQRTSSPESEDERPKKRVRRSRPAVKSSPSQQSSPITVPGKRRGRPPKNSRLRQDEASPATPVPNTDTSSPSARKKENQSLDWRAQRPHIKNGGREILVDIEAKRDGARTKGYKTVMLAENQLHPQDNPRRVPPIPPPQEDNSIVDADNLKRKFRFEFDVGMQVVILGLLNSRINTLRDRFKPRYQRQHRRLERFREEMRLANSGLVTDDVQLETPDDGIEHHEGEVDTIRGIRSNHKDLSPARAVDVEKTQQVNSTSSIASARSSLASVLDSSRIKRHDSAASVSPPSGSTLPTPPSIIHSRHPHIASDTASASSSTPPFIALSNYIRNDTRAEHAIRAERHDQETTARRDRRIRKEVAQIGSWPVVDLDDLEEESDDHSSARHEREGSKLSSRSQKLREPSKRRSDAMASDRLASNEKKVHSVGQNATRVLDDNDDSDGESGNESDPSLDGEQRGRNGVVARKVNDDFGKDMLYEESYQGFDEDASDEEIRDSEDDAEMCATS